MLFLEQTSCYTVDNGGWKEVLRGLENSKNTKPNMVVVVMMTRCLIAQHGVEYRKFASKNEIT